MLALLFLLLFLLPSCCFAAFWISLCPAATASEELCEESVVEMLLLGWCWSLASLLLSLNTLGSLVWVSFRWWWWCANGELPSSLELLDFEFGTTG